MNSFELFTMVFFTLDAYWDEHKGEELGNFLSGMNPFLFEGIGSAISSVYIDFCGFLNERTITRENSFEIAKEYVLSLDKDYIVNAFEWIDKKKWDDSCKEYLAEHHKGGETRAE